MKWSFFSIFDSFFRRLFRSRTIYGFLSYLNNCKSTIWFFYNDGKLFLRWLLGLYTFSRMQKRLLERGSHRLGTIIAFRFDALSSLPPIQIQKFICRGLDVAFGLPSWLLTLLRPHTLIMKTLCSFNCFMCCYLYDFTKLGILWLQIFSTFI